MNGFREVFASVAEGGSRRKKWTIHLLALQEGWSGFLLPQSFPIAGDRGDYTALFHALLDSASDTRAPNEIQAFLMMDRIDFRRETPIVQQHTQHLGDYGLGIYPEQGAPTTWTKEEFLDKVAPEKLRPLAHDVMKVDGDAKAIAEIRRGFLGSGAYVELYCPPDTAFYRNATNQFKPGITDPILRTFPYHAPLLTRQALEAASAERLNEWSCGAALYARESVEDGGLLVLSRGDLRPMLAQWTEQPPLPEVEIVVR